MKLYNIVAFGLCVLWNIKVFGVEIKDIETTRNMPQVLEILLKKGHDKPTKISDYETVSFSEDEMIIFSCTTENVHLWDGVIDHEKFEVTTRTIQRNSGGYFNSMLMLKLRTLSSENSASSLPENFIKCIELGNEKKRTETCIYIDGKSKVKAKSSTNNKEEDYRFFVNVDECLQIKPESENGFSPNNDLSTLADAPEWKWNAENNSVVCHAKNLSRMTLKSISCDNPSSCNIRRHCTIQTCPSSVVSAPPCESSCHRQEMQINQVSGQLVCEANGLLTQLNFIKDLDHKTCFFKSIELVPDCNLLELDIPDFDIPDGFPVNFSGRASKFLIIQKPEVQIIFKDGKVMNPDVFVVPKLRNQKKISYFTFMVTITASLDIESVKILGYRFDSDQPMTVTKRTNVKVGARPEIQGLPTELEIPTHLITLVAFRVFGSPEPSLTMTFNKTALHKPYVTFSVHIISKDHGYLKIFPKYSNFTGVLEISAQNTFGRYNSTIIIKEMWELMYMQSFLIVLLIFIFLILLILCTVVNFIPRFPERRRQRQTAEHD